MAFTQKPDFAFKHVDQPGTELAGDLPAVKTLLDSPAKELRDYLNGVLLAEMASVTDGASGADNIGATTIAGLTGATVQALLEALKDYTDTNFATGNFTGTLNGAYITASDPGLSSLFNAHTESEIRHITANERTAWNGKTEQAYVDSQLALKANQADVNSQIAAMANGSPKAVYATLAALQTAFPAGNTNIYIVTADGNWYYWSGSAWTAGGVYQSTGISDESVALAKITQDSRSYLSYSRNRLLEVQNRITKNDFKLNADGTSNVQSTNATVTAAEITESDPPTNVGRKLVVSYTSASISHFSVRTLPHNNKPIKFGAWFKKSELLAMAAAVQLYPSFYLSTPAVETTVTAASAGFTANSLAVVGAKKTVVSNGVTITAETIAEHNDYVFISMYTDTALADTTIYSFYITLQGKTVAGTLTLYDPFVCPAEYKRVPRVGYANSNWVGKVARSLGDSITWQDGKAYTQGDIGAIARGYQTILAEKLGFSAFYNSGLSGRPMANGTANGDGTNTTGKALTYTDTDLVIIAAGTNDFKLNVPLGALGVIGDVGFNTATFYGAYRDLIEYILTNNPNVRIALFTPLQRDQSGYDVNTVNTAGHKLIDYANAVKAIGQLYGLPVCDMYADSGFTKLTLATFTMDGLHPNDIGYARMGDYAAKFINAI